MNPFFFGTSERPLYGVYHPPAGRDVRRSGVVLCYPFGHEYLRAHRAFRQLATQLSRAGFHVLRFDYSGTGDSAGSGEDADLAQWQQDISAACDELKDTAAVSTLWLVGLRLGASLAVRAATARHDVVGLVLWNPIVTGSRYVEELLAAAGYAGRSDNGASPGAHMATEAIGVGGFPLTPRLRAGIEGIELLGKDAPQAPTIHFVVSSERPEHVRFRSQLEQRGVCPAYRQVNAGSWSETDDEVTGLVPGEILQDIVAGLTRSADG